MSWVSIDDEFPDHPKIVGLTDRAFRLHVAALCYSNRYLTDGHLSPAAVTRLRGTPRETSGLVTAGVWERVDGGWVIHDFADYQPSRYEIEEKKRLLNRVRSAAGKKGAEVRWGDNADGKPVATASQTDDPNPNPKLSEEGWHPSTGKPMPTVDAVWDVIAQKKYAQAVANGQHIPHPDRWMATVVHNEREAKYERAKKIVEDRPTISTSMLADVLLGAVRLLALVPRVETDEEIA